ncbi:Phosphoglycerol transferase MdoB [Ruminococcaceae bacterium YRB3002]|nr:Phosphoglycerol transferase MdoB [Ruminococcaceae bacterium YRB3002]
MDIDVSKITGAVKSNFRFEKRDIVRIAVCFAVALVEFVLLAMRYSEAAAGIVLFFVLTVPTFKVKGQHRFILDIIFPVYCGMFVMYYCQLGDLYGHAMTDALFSFWGYLLLQDRLLHEIIFVIAVYYIFRLFAMSPKVAAICCPIPFMLLSIVNYYVYQFRGHELVFNDIMSAKTAANVMGSYSYPVAVPLIFIVIPYALFIMLFVHMEVEKSKMFIAWRELIFAGATALSVFLSGVSVNSWFADGNHMFREWGDMMSVANGYFLSFAESVRASIITPPSGYSQDALNTALRENNYSVNHVLAGDDTANIIVIMSESYADLSIYEDITGKTDNPDPYWDTLRQTCINGYAMSSVFGGNTANSEFEFLTGLSMANLPSSSIAYHSYIKDDMYSIVRALDDADYDTYVMHPYVADGWNRLTVYPLLGFQKMMFIDDFEYTNDDLICGKVSDRCAYENMLRVLDEHDKTSGNKTFTYLITMQNHGGYYYEDYEPDTYTTVFGDYQNKEFNSFMTLINESDKALEYLLDELSARDEKYVVLIFGDHQPELSLTDPNDYVAAGRAWVVPYLLWTNYDLTEEQRAGIGGTGNFTSLNYLGIDALKAAGFELNPYYRLIDDVRVKVPMMNSAGYIDQDGGVYPDGAETGKGEVDKIMKLYEYLEYNILFDGGNNELLKN